MKTFNRGKKSINNGSTASSSGASDKKPATVIKQSLQDKAIDFIKAGNIEALEKMCEEGSEELRFLNKLHTKSGKSSLCVAADEGRIGSVEILLKAKPTLDLVDGNGMTAVLYAAKSGEADILEMLVLAGADVQLKSTTKIENGLMLASAHNHFKCVQSLVTYGLPVDDKNKFEETALSISLKFEYLDISAYLLERGADINVVGQGGNTPIIRTAFDGRDVTAKFILENQGNVNAVNNNGETPLLVACKFGNNTLMKMFLAAGADPKRGDVTGKTPLMYACMMLKVSTVQELLSHTAAVDQTDAWGYSALSHACSFKSFSTDTQRQYALEIIEMLIGAGASVDHQDRAYKTPLMLACGNGNMDIAMPLLFKFGGNPFIKNIDNIAMIDLIQDEKKRQQFGDAMSQIDSTLLQLQAQQMLKPDWINTLNAKKK